MRAAKERLYAAVCLSFFSDVSSFSLSVDDVVGLTERIGSEAKDGRLDDERFLGRGVVPTGVVDEDEDDRLETNGFRTGLGRTVSVEGPGKRSLARASFRADRFRDVSAKLCRRDGSLPSDEPDTERNGGSDTARAVGDPGSSLFVEGAGLDTERTEAVVDTFRGVGLERGPEPKEDG